ncbi:multicopper oxidase family protein [Stackebrandtia nassauensis]|uniref:Multicopper oxidase type 3 n=1 Tax=Stackebrandtia nassauensis (strain DSM 44728 / CIP 108903 / NRRL B-16338 / NBRC 102104 / LLR-40K-21) TaxID=446470 RepID=D3PWY4_STANL|nr:multicopper oxidase family protein [Stackebrandtia nassauensis]ADD45208.1 multicopper oxidase type 3 [Stackebrandtia nassauensis DSM 44728]
MSPVSRRSVLRAGVAASGAAILTGCASESADSYVSPDGDRVAEAEAARDPGKVRKFTLKPGRTEVDLGGVAVTTWAYGGKIPGEPIRVTRGEQIKAVLDNGLPDPTTVHWHGLALRCDADGVPDVTQKPVGAGERHTYTFTAAHAGTYWFHPHVGVQQDRGLYAPLIVEDPDEPLSYDEEWIVVLDDWMDGVTGSPDDVLKELGGGMSHGGHSGGDSDDEPQSQGHMLMGADSDLLGGDAGDVSYPHFLINGRVPADPEVFKVKPGTRLRLRVINAAGDTAFRLALGGHTMTVTHTDGFGVRHTETDALLLGMGERYDVLVELGDGVFPLVALAEGKQELARAIVRTASGETPAADVRPTELDGTIAGYSDLEPDDSVRLKRRDPDETIDLDLTGGMMKYDWGINGESFDPDRLYGITEGDRVRLRFKNTTTMWHPMHLHGHTFALSGTGLRKDTAIVLPGQTLKVDFDADNPGRWMIHCHNVYHSESGMMTLLGYRD